jgi:plasmid maintenance system killer protein
MNPSEKMIRTLKAYPLAVLSVLVFLICSAVIHLRAGAVADLSVHEADLNLRIRTIDQNVRNANNLDKDFEEIKRLVDQIEARLFKRDQRAVNINFFYALENRLNVRILNISQMPNEDSLYAKGGARELKLHSTITYNISLNGNFENILLFLYELQRVDPLIRVVDFQIAKDNAQEADEECLDARLRLIVLAEK